MLNLFDDNSFHGWDLFRFKPVAWQECGWLRTCRLWSYCKRSCVDNTGVSGNPPSLTWIVVSWPCKWTTAGWKTSTGYLVTALDMQHNERKACQELHIRSNLIPKRWRTLPGIPLFLFYLNPLEQYETGVMKWTSKLLRCKDELTIHTKQTVPPLKDTSLLSHGVFDIFH